MKAKKFWATLVCALIMVSFVLTVPSGSPAYAEAKTHLGVSPLDMVTLISRNNNSYNDPDNTNHGIFKRLNYNGVLTNFLSVPEGKVLLITDVTIFAAQVASTPFDFYLWQFFYEGGENTYAQIPFKCNFAGLTNYKITFTSGLTFYPLNKIKWNHTGPGGEQTDSIQVGLYGYLIDAPSIFPPSRQVHQGPPSNPPGAK